jgi:ATP-dependent DNA ligase
MPQLTSNQATEVGSRPVSGGPKNPSRNPTSRPYLNGMPKFEFCIPTSGKAVPADSDWFHEVKYDGYRLRIERG